MILRLQGMRRARGCCWRGLAALQPSAPHSGWGSPARTPAAPEVADPPLPPPAEAGPAPPARLPGAVQGPPLGPPLAPRTQAPFVTVPRIFPSSLLAWVWGSGGPCSFRWQTGVCFLITHHTYLGRLLLRVKDQHVYKTPNLTQWQRLRSATPVPPRDEPPPPAWAACGLVARGPPAHAPRLRWAAFNTFTRGEEIVNLLLTDLLKNILFSV